MTGTIIFNGTSSDDFGLIVEKLPPSVHASRRGDLISIPGRNGVIVREDGSYDTYQQEYQISFTQAAQNRDPYQTARDIAVWLLGASGFCRLEDGFEPEHFRLARYSGAFDVDTVLMEYGKATLTFDVQPQRYLESGETPLTFRGGSVYTITNPTNFEARPLLRFTDTSSSPSPVAVTLTMREDYIINSGGEVVDVSGDASMLGYAVSNSVNCSGKEYALVTGDGYAFLDSNGNSRSGGFSPTAGWSGGATRVNYRISVPSWAASIVVSRGRNTGDTAALSLMDFRPNPGASAVTINGTTVNLDFSEQGTIYLDCDLHDAYYEGGGNANNMVSFSSSVTAYPTFPGLVPGANTISPNNGAILDFALTPRWWTL